MKSLQFKQKHRKIKKDLRGLHIHLLKFYSLIRKVVSNKKGISRSLHPKVLILRTGDQVGDAIICTGLAKKLHERGYQVSFLAGESCKNLFAHSVFIKNVFIYDRKKSPLQLKKENFDIVIDLSDDVSFSRINLVYTMNARATIGFNKSTYPMYTNSIEFMNVDVHITERHKKVLDLLGIESSHYDYFLNVNKQDEETVVSEVKSKSFTYLVALNPLTSSKDKDLSKKQVNEIVNFIKGNYLGVGIVLIGKYERVSELQTEGCIVFPESTISLAISIVKHADLVITPDTSIVHLSRAFNKKMLAIYNNGRLEESCFFAYNVWLPGYKNATVIRADTPYVRDFNPAEIISKIKEIIPAELSVNMGEPVS